MRQTAVSCCLLLALLAAGPVRAAEAIDIKFTHAEQDAHWRQRIQSLIDRGKLPLIDMETSLKEEQADAYVPGVFDTMDDLGIALMAADGYQRPRDDTPGYRWSFYIRDLVNRYPGRFIATANGGTSPSWLQEKSGEGQFIAQMETYVRAGVYRHMGEFDFRHYMSSSQCKQNRTDRDTDIAPASEIGRRAFQLSAETGVPFGIHLEPEDAALDGLETMLAAYPKAKVIVAHFGQVRHPERQKHFTPDRVRHLLGTYPNLYYDLSTGQPNRKYFCSGPDNASVLAADTVLWAEANGRQADTLKPEWRAILAEFADRFVFATDYGGGRKALPDFLRDKVENFNRIVHGLPDGAKRNIAYKNAWKILTGKPWD